MILFLKNKWLRMEIENFVELKEEIHSEKELAEYMSWN